MLTAQVAASRPVPQTISKRLAPSNLRRWHFLRILIEMRGLKTGAELGVATGRFTEFLLRNLPDLNLIAVDRWSPLGDGSDYDKWDHGEHERVFREKVAPYLDRLRIIREWTVDAAKQVEDASLDFVFVDADHSEAGCRADITAWLPKLKPTGWMTGHDINWIGVRAAVDDLMPDYLIGPDKVWFRPVNPTADWQKDFQ